MKGEQFYDPGTELPDGTKIDAGPEIRGDEKLPEVEALADELTELAGDRDTLAAQLEALQVEGELPIDQRSFFGQVHGEAESLGGVLQLLGKTGGLKRGLALATAVIGISLMSGREANAGNKKPFNWETLVNGGVKVATVLIQEKSRTNQEEARTVRTIGTEQIRTERDATLEKERTARTIGTEEIKKEKEVSLGAMRVEKPTSIEYISGGKKVTIDIKKGEEEKKKLEEENRALKEQIRILQLQQENEKLKQQLKDQESKTGGSEEGADGGNQ